MAHRILIPTPLRPFAGKQEFVEVEGRTVGDALQRLVGQYTDLKRHLYNEDGRLRRADTTGGGSAADGLGLGRARSSAGCAVAASSLPRATGRQRSLRLVGCPD